ncbi:YaiO family outer membrane beta-barrel protein [Cellulophaga tyrosinoxydans]|uniref:Outer membrane protein, YaiO family n=1 Tax=Cellulophaga tyrosinoxydans TaxID=504486 RepID=A0A1W2BLG7_9FLAO|nr:YaiO family outer membrane beta-barrel protein [Cellulophaga tyrosinoxydans]SMC73613.1 outer membrane protein, YaiO family [Cellulophaga tyrosinoxydans]
MKFKQTLFFLPVFFFLSALQAQEKVYAGNPDASFMKAREIAFAGDRVAARDSLKLILSAYPDYADVRNLLAKTYSWDGNYDKARNEFNAIISKEKLNLEVWEAAIKNEIYAENYYIALGLSNKALLYFPDNLEIKALHEKAEIGITVAKTVEEVIYLDAEAGETTNNAIGLSAAADVFDVIYDPMLYASIYYNRKTKYGAIIPRINYSNRFQTNGVQYEIDAYPKFSKKLNAYLNYGFSNSEIYPNHRAGAELYANLPKAMEASLGVRYLDFNTSNVFVYTGSFGMYRGNYYFSLRPYVTPSANNTYNISGNLLARKYFKDKYNFLGVNLSYGYASDLKQFKNGSVVLAETLLYLESQQIQIEYQFTIKENPSVYRASMGITRQELSFDPGKFFYAASIGLDYQFKF